jgi:hypothetical protein
MVLKRLLAGAASALGITSADAAKAQVEHDARPTRAQELVMGYYAEADLSQGFLPYIDYKAPHANRPTPRRPHFRRPARLDFAGSAFPGRLFKGYRP